jgi:hypothetical protein
VRRCLRLEPEAGGLDDVHMRSNVCLLLRS